MIFLAIFILLNAFANNFSVVNEYRVNVAGVPVNMFDGLLIIGVLLALIRPTALSGYFRTPRMHPAMVACMVLFVLAFFGGLIGAMNNGATARQVMTCARNFLAAPAGMYVAYVLTANFKSSRGFLHISVFAGIVVSFMIVLFFREKAVIVKNVTNIRAIAYVSPYAGLAAALMFFSLSAKLRLYPLIIALGIVCICVVGQFTTLSRSDWLAALAGVLAVVACLPRGIRARSVLRMKLALPFLAACLVLGLYVGSKVTGKNMFEKMKDRVLTMLPGDRPGTTKSKAWDTRLPSTFKELRLWASSPIIGRGLGIQDTPEAEPMFYGGLRHNTWSATLAETGLLGFMAFSVMIFGTMIAGWRMSLARTDQTTILMGALGVATAAFYVIHGMATMSFNQMRGGLPLFMVAGAVLRTRAMQLAQMEQDAAEQAYLAEHYNDPAYTDADGMVQQPQTEESAVGNWYGSN